MTNNLETRIASRVAFPPHLFIGLALIAVFWTAAWARWGIISEYAFLPLWLGYILTMDAFVVMRRGSSFLTAHPRAFVSLFVISAPIWWLFEGLNEFTHNWHYYVPVNYSALQIIVVATINFTIVIPAVFETTQFLLTFLVFQRLEFPRLAFPLPRAALWALMYLGAAMFFIVWLYPMQAFGLIWGWLILVLDAQNALRGRPSLFVQLSRGDWRLVAALAYATLICGFFWEMWNFYAFPKWYYTVPIVGNWKIFEMPLVGFSGYIPFALELFALYQFICGVLKVKPLEI